MAHSGLARRSEALPAEPPRRSPPADPVRLWTPPADPPRLSPPLLTGDPLFSIRRFVAPEKLST